MDVEPCEVRIKTKRANRELEVNVVWEINPDPTSHDLARWRKVCDILLKAVPERIREE